MAFTKNEEVAVVRPANIKTVTIYIRGTAPYMQCKFSKKAKELMMLTMSTSKAEKKAKSERPVRNYDRDFAEAAHLSTDKWYGIPCTAFRTAMIDACRTVGLVMTRAKMSVFILPDGFDKDDGTPLVKLLSKDPPERTELPVRLDNGSADIRIRPMWREWGASVQVQYDADMITTESVVNLMDRAGKQVGIGEGRPFSKNSVGQGLGTFMVKTE